MASKKQLEELTACLTARLDSLDKNVSDLKGQVNNLESLLAAANERNRELVTALEHKDQQIDTLTLRLNGLEQHNRSWSIRVHGLSLTSEEETDNNRVKAKLYDKVLLPILEGAADAGDLPYLPAVDELIEHAHVLPNNGKSSIKPIIARFFRREHRGVIFKHKKNHAPRDTETARPGFPGKYKYSIFEDLTRLTFQKMRAIANHPAVAASWSAGGQIRFKLKDRETVYKVKSILDPVEKIINV